MAYITAAGFGCSYAIQARPAHLSLFRGLTSALVTGVARTARTLSFALFFALLAIGYSLALVTVGIFAEITRTWDVAITRAAALRRHWRCAIAREMIRHRWIIAETGAF